MVLVVIVTHRGSTFQHSPKISKGMDCKQQVKYPKFETTTPRENSNITNIIIITDISVGYDDVQVSYLYHIANDHNSIFTQYVVLKQVLELTVMVLKVPI